MPSYSSCWSPGCWNELNIDSIPCGFIETLYGSFQIDVHVSQDQIASHHVHFVYLNHIIVLVKKELLVSNLFEPQCSWSASEVKWLNSMAKSLNSKSFGFGHERGDGGMMTHLFSHHSKLLVNVFVCLSKDGVEWFFISVSLRHVMSNLKHSTQC